MKLDFKRYRLKFKFTAGTSRGTMDSKDSWILKLSDSENPEVFGLGECGPLPGLSPDFNGDVEQEIVALKNELDSNPLLTVEDVFECIPHQFPALRFALETATLDLDNGGKRVIYNNDFCSSEKVIPINGLVWMGNQSEMLDRINQKISEGYDCIKIKIGAINFEDELSLISYIRSRFDSNKVTIRLDANGAFDPENAPMILEQLNYYDIHSIEQPIMAGDWNSMEKLCDQSPIPIALDEELIGIDDVDVKRQMLESISPSYIILKPTMVGGMQKSKEWIEIAEEQGIGWWVTSALESNIGLNAIAQFTSEFNISLPQGLGTGQLYHNNIESPLIIQSATLKYDLEKSWDLSYLF